MSLGVEGATWPSPANMGIPLRRLGSKRKFSNGHGYELTAHPPNRQDCFVDPVIVVVISRSLMVAIRRPWSS